MLGLQYTVDCFYSFMKSGTFISAVILLIFVVIEVTLNRAYIITGKV